jgi:uncharacterized membrane protein YqaE (UPF0057 family)
MGFWRIVFTIILPPLGVLLGKGFGWAFILNMPLIAGLHPKGVDQAWNIAQQGQNNVENKRPAETFA